MGYRLFDHQELVVAMMDANRQMGIFADLGTGKTNMALFWALRAYKRGEPVDMLVVCPAALVRSWEQAIDRMSAFDEVSPEDISVMRRIVTIRSYQKTYSIERVKKGDKESRVIHLRDDVDKPWYAVIVDESHCIGAHNSVQTKAAITLSKLARHRYIMSATPVHGAAGRESFEKLYGQMQFLYQGMLWKNWTEFCVRYVTSWNRFRKPVGWRTAECHKLMENNAMVIRKEDCLDLPGFTQIEIPCEIAEARMYKDVAHRNYSKYGIRVETAGGEYTKLLQIVSGSCKLGDGTVRTDLRTSKDDALKTLLEGTEDRMIVFCTYTASIDRVEKVCRACGKEPIVYDGRSKRVTWEDFQNGKGDVLILQFASGAYGLNLQNCSICVYFEPCWSALQLEQSAGRIYRPGQTVKCRYYYLVTQDSLEEDVWKEVREGRDVSNQTLIDLAHHRYGERYRCFRFIKHYYILHMICKIRHYKDGVKHE